MPPPSPPIDDRSYDALVRATEALVQAYTRDPAIPGSGWRPPPEGQPDLASALIRSFGRMVRQVVERVNRAPDRNFVAFLNLIGAEPTPPRPARVPLTFTLAQGSTAEAVVPAGTRIGAEPAPDDTDEVVFETTRELVISQAKLVSVFTRGYDGDLYADRSVTAAAGGTGLYDAFSGDQPVEHSLYLSADEILGLAAGTPATLTFEFATSDELTRWRSLNAATLPPLIHSNYVDNHPPTAPLLEWSYWNGQQWQALGPLSQPDAPASPPSWRLGFRVPADIAPVTVREQSARWLRVRLKAWPMAPIPAVARVTASATLAPTGIAPDQALTGGRPIDLSMDFYPLQEQPRFNDTFYVSNADVFSRAGATVTVTVTPSGHMSPLKDTDNPTIAWEVSTSGGWTKVATTTPSKTKAGDKLIANDALRTLTFTMPANPAPAVVEGTSGYWLRLRLVNGDFGKGLQLVSGTGTTATAVDDGYRPPILESMTLGYTHQPQAAATCVALNDMIFTPCVPGTIPFVRAPDPRSALYLGFDRPFSNRPTQLYVQVAPPSADVARAGALQDAGAPPQVVWEYATPNGWVDLGARDETRGFAGSGVIEFIGPTDFAQRSEFGVVQYWIRARLVEEQLSVMPRLGRVLLNTTWATHSVTIFGEELGSSDQSANQAFTLASAPVLAGEQIEVLEPELPPAEEQAAIERLEGPGAIAEVPTTDGSPPEIWVRWHAVPDFYASGPRDRHYQIEHTSGRIRFGDGLHGMVPPRGVRNLRATRYQTGGGAHGNRPVGTITQLKTTIPYVDGVINYEGSSGGADAESLDRVKERAPRVLRHGDRAVTAEDYEDLARQASSAVARARAITPTFDPIQQEESQVPVADAGRVTVSLVPFGTEPRPTPSLGLLQDVRAFLTARCSPSVTLALTGPLWIEVSITQLIVIPVSFEQADGLRAAILDALDRFFHPLTGGLDGNGWDFGQVPYKSDILGLVTSLPGVESVQGLTVRMTWSGSDRVFDEATAGRDLERVLVSTGSHTVQIAAPEGEG